MTAPIDLDANPSCPWRPMRKLRNRLPRKAKKLAKRPGQMVVMSYRRGVDHFDPTQFGMFWRRPNGS